MFGCYSLKILSFVTLLSKYFWSVSINRDAQIYLRNCCEPLKHFRESFQEIKNSSVELASSYWIDPKFEENRFCLLTKHLNELARWEDSEEKFRVIYGVRCLNYSVRFLNFSSRISFEAFQTTAEKFILESQNIDNICDNELYRLSKCIRDHCSIDGSLFLIAWWVFDLY